MAQTGITPTLLYGSVTPSATPLAANLVTSANGVELAVNAADGKLFYKDSNGAVQLLASKAAAALGTSTTGSGATVLQTNATITAPTINNPTITNGTLTTPTINKINTSVANTSLGAGNASIMKNRIINGAMVIDQRNAGASVSVTTANPFTLDRWHAYASQSSKYTVQQNAGSVTPPVGFTNYLGVTSSSAYSVLAGDYFFLNQNIEGFNFADLGWGTANAKTVTLSFWVYSSLTGTFGGSYQNDISNRSYPFTYSIPVANTWTQIGITIAGDTSGTWVGATNGIGLQLSLSVGAGSTYSGTAGSWAGADYRSATGATSVVGTNGATFYITGVQLEVGTSATGFEYRQYGTELALCQRYYETSWYDSAVGVDNSAVATTGYYGTSDGLGGLWFSWRVTKRSQPSIQIWSPGASPSANKIRQADNGAIATISDLTTFGNVAAFIGGIASRNYQYGWSADAEL